MKVESAAWRARLAPQGKMWWAVALLLGFLIGAYYVRLWPRVNNKDFRVFVEAGAALTRGGDIYADTDAFKAFYSSGAFNPDDTELRWPYAYPPLGAILAIPLAALPYEPLALAWTVANVLMLVAGGWLCLRAQGPVEPLDVALLGVALYAFYPAVVTVRLGQIEILQFLLLAGTFLALKRRRDGLAGVLLGFATALKLFPGALIVFLFWKRLWRPAAIALATTLVLLVGSFAVVGLGQVPRYLAFTSVYTRGGFAAFPFNQSLHGFFARNLTANPFVVPLKGWHLPWLADGLTVGLALLLVGGWAWLTWRPLALSLSPRGRGEKAALELQRGRGGDEEASARFDREFSGAIALLLLTLPHSQVYAFVWLLMPFLVLVYQLRRAGPAWAWLPALAAYVLAGRHFLLIHPGLTRLAVSHVMFGALLLLFLMGALLWWGQRGSTGGQTR